jgi:hypothetical protein
MAEVQVIWQGGWRVGKHAAAATAAATKELTTASEKFDFVLQPFDNTAYHARTCEGGLIPCRKEPLSGTNHIDADLVVQPVEALESVFNDWLPILEAWGTTQVVLLVTTATVHHTWVL